MLEFKVNPYHRSLDLTEVFSLSHKLISLLDENLNLPESASSFAELIGVGNEANGKVYSLLGTDFCLKVSQLGKHVGKNQELQFKLADQCREAIAGKSIAIEGESYKLDCIPPVAVTVDGQNAYTLMIRHDNTLRLWDEENIHFNDKENWDAISEINGIFRTYGGEDFVSAMDVNGNNILVDAEKSTIYLIDTYVPIDA